LNLNLDKLSLELKNIKKTQNTINDTNKTEHKVIISDIEQIKNQLLGYQTNLGTQGSKLNILEKEVTIFKTSSLNFSPYDSSEILKSTGFTARGASNYRNLSISKSDNETEITDFSGLNNLSGNIKAEENLNFLICVKNNFFNFLKIVKTFRKHRKHCEECSSNTRTL
jgi:hypothetical protein